MALTSPASSTAQTQEELLHAVGFTALERGHNVLTYDGPGQRSGLSLSPARDRLHLRLGEEKVVTPAVDLLDTTPSAWP
jgi:hypothetical protein